MENTPVFVLTTGSSTPGIPLPSRAGYSPRETGILLNCSHATIYRLIGKGALDARKIGSKTIITAASIARLIEAAPKAPVAA